MRRCVKDCLPPAAVSISHPAGCLGPAWAVGALAHMEMYNSGKMQRYSSEISDSLHYGEDEKCDFCDGLLLISTRVD